MSYLCRLRSVVCVGRSWITVAHHTTLAAAENNVESSCSTKMAAWYMEKYAGIASMLYNPAAALPVVRSTNDVLIEVHAASVNPLDVEMTKGYGRGVTATMRTLLNLADNDLTEFPLILGRDFSGIVSDKGLNVQQFQVGDEVMGVILAPRQGSHAQYTVTPANMMIKKPSNLSHEEAASLCYSGLTAWSALTCFGDLGPKKSKGKRVLIFGGSGGVGNVAIQFLKAWEAEVGCVASTSAIDLVSSLGADVVFDYTKPHWQNELRQVQGFDVVLNCISHSASGLIETAVLKKWANAKYVTLNTPFLRNIDAFGWPLGLLQSAAEFGYDSVNKLLNGQWHRWAYVLPCSAGLKEIVKLVESGKLVPVIEAVYPMNAVQSAFEKVNSGHSRGKTVIRVKDPPTQRS